MAEATIHDYTRQRWGWALHSPEVVEYSEEPTLWERLWGRKERSGMYLSCMGHGKGIRPGHHLRVAMISGRVAQYRVDEIEYFSNPRDMFHIKRAEWVSYGSLPNPLDLETRG